MRHKKKEKKCVETTELAKVFHIKLTNNSFSVRKEERKNMLK